MSYYINKIKTDRSPLKRAAALVEGVLTETEMSAFDSSFLCGLLQKVRPKKIVEVGVSSGGTTAVVLQCLTDMGYDFEMYSVELLNHVYYDETKPAGYLGQEATEKLRVKNGAHRFFNGTVLPDCVEEIGGGIDFLILDTTHVLPGEVLEFLTAYPYLTEDAFVCMHDIRQNFKRVETAESIATNVLFCSVAAEKYVNEDRQRTHGYPNIGAFQITPDTGTYLTNVAGALMLSWKRMPEKKQLASYLRIMKRHYDSSLMWIVRHAVALNHDRFKEK